MWFVFGSLVLLGLELEGFWLLDVVVGCLFRGRKEGVRPAVMGLIIVVVILICCVFSRERVFSSAEFSGSHLCVLCTLEVCDLFSDN